MLGGGERTSEERLIDVAETDVLAHEFGERLGIVPTLVPHFDHARILDELAQQLLEVFTIQAGVLERDRKLDEQRSERAFRGQRI